MPSLYLPSHYNEKGPKDRIVSELQPHFKFNLNDRIVVKADVNQFNKKEDESVWKQAKGLAPNYYEVYWDGVWLFDFSENEPVEFVIQKFWLGFRNAYDSEQIHLRTPEEIKQQDDKDRLDEMVKKVQREMSEKTESDRLAKEAVLGVLEEKKTKRDKARKKFESKFKD